MAVKETQAAIAPGSTDYGERGELEGAVSASLSSPAGSQEPTLGSASPVPTAGGLPASPLDFLNDGTHSSDLPVTSGVSVGPGEGPMSPFADLPVDRMTRLQTIATQAKSAYVRQAARQALRAIAQQQGR